MTEVEKARTALAEALCVRLVTLVQQNNLLLTMSSYEELEVLARDGKDSIVFSRSIHTDTVSREMPLIEQAVIAVEHWLMVRSESLKWMVTPTEPRSRRFLVGKHSMLSPPLVSAGRHAYIAVVRRLADGQKDVLDIVAGAEVDMHHDAVRPDVVEGPTFDCDTHDRVTGTVLAYVHIRGLMNIGDSDIEQVTIP